MSNAVEEALKIAENARALTEPKVWKDYGASIDFKQDLLPHLAVLGGEVLRLRQELEGAKKALEDIATMDCAKGSHAPIAAISALAGVPGGYGAGANERTLAIIDAFKKDRPDLFKP